MNIEGVMDYIIVNGEIEPLGDQLEQMDFGVAPIYEVIRVCKGHPLFMDEHLERMAQSAKLRGYDLAGKFDQIRENLITLIERNRVEDNNIRITIGHEGTLMAMFCVKSYYPPASLYASGVKTTLLNRERKNPHAKVVNYDLAAEVEKIKRATGIFEALLVDDNGRITEGSKSNVFFIENRKVVSAKSGAILQGITRLKLLELLDEMDIAFVERNVELEDLKDFQGCFLTGTSINVLPVCAIDEIAFDVEGHDLLNRIVEGFKDKVFQDLT